MQVGFGGVNVSPAAASVLNAEQSMRRVSGQATERPVREPSEVEPRTREEVEAQEKKLLQGLGKYFIIAFVIVALIMIGAFAI